jgi:hypothetical protein
VKQAEKDLKSVGAAPDLTSGTAVGYWSAIVFEQMLKATLKAEGGNPAKVTGATLEKTVTSGFTHTDPIAGGIGTETFPAAESIPTGCGTLAKTTGTTFADLAVPVHRCGQREVQQQGEPDNGQVATSGCRLPVRPVAVAAQKRTHEQGGALRRPVPCPRNALMWPSPQSSFSFVYVHFGGLGNVR